MEREQTLDTRITTTPEDSSDSEYSLRVEEVIKDVINDLLLNDIKGIRSIPRKKNTLRNRTIIYLDAIRQGLPIVEEAAKLGNLTIPTPDGSAVKRYLKTDTGQVKWVLEPTSTDPFAQIKFYQKLNQSGQPKEEVVEPLTDPFLVTQMLQEGLAKQDSSFLQYQGALNRILRIKESHQHILEYLDSVTDQSEQSLGFFKEVLDIKAKLKDQKANNEREAFALFTLNSDTSLLESIPKAELIGLSIEALDNLYQTVDPREGPKKVERHRRPEFNNTVVIELVSNPDFLNDPTNLRTPTTTQSRLLNLNQMINSLKKEYPGDKFKEAIWMITENTIEKNQDKLTEALKIYQIDSDIGFEYFKSLLLTTLPNLPESSNIYTNPENPDLPPIFENILNQYYIFETPLIDYPPVSERQLRTQTPSMTEAHFISSSLDPKHPFYVRRFALWDERQRESILNRLLETGNKKSPALELPFRQLLVKLQNALRLGYSKQDGLYTVQTSRFVRIDDDKWLPASQISLLKIYQRKILEEDELTIKAIEGQIRNAEFPEFAKSIAVPIGDWKDYSNLVYKALQDMAHSKVTFNSTRNLINRYSAVAIAALHGLDSSSDDYTLTKETTQQMLRLEISPHNTISQNYPLTRNPDFYNQLDKLSGLLRDDSILSLVTKLEHDYQVSHFGVDYPNNKKGYLAKIIERSLESLHSTKKIEEKS